MNPPGRTDRMLGRPGSRLAFTALFAVALYGAATQQVPWPVPALLFFLAFAARGAEARVGAYREWRGAWDEMAGLSPASRAARPARGRLTPGRAAFLLLWGAPAYWLSQHAALSGTPTYAAFAWTFLLTSAGGIAWLFLPALRRLGGGTPRRSARSSRAKAERALVVSACLPISRTSPDARRIVRALPPYARDLLLRQAAPAPAVQPSAAHPRPENRPN